LASEERRALLTGGLAFVLVMLVTAGRTDWVSAPMPDAGTSSIASTATAKVAPQTRPPVSEDEPDAGPYAVLKRPLFACYRASWAWGRTFYGSVVDDNGKIYSFDRKGAYWNRKPVQKRDADAGPEASGWTHVHGDFPLTEWWWDGKQLPEMFQRAVPKGRWI
jgi:hypothetical protein